MVDKNKLSGRMKTIKATVPEEVADFYEKQKQQYASTMSAVVATPICALAYGDFRIGYTANIDPARLRP